MDAVVRELTLLKMSLMTLEDDNASRRISYPAEMKTQIHGILLNIEVITQQINDLLTLLSSGKLDRRISWAFHEQDETNKLRSSLESNKSALDIALTIGTISMLAQQKRKVVKQGNDIAIVIQQTESISTMATTIDRKIDNRRSAKGQYAIQKHSRRGCAASNTADRCLEDKFVFC